MKTAAVWARPLLTSCLYLTFRSKENLLCVKKTLDPRAAANHEFSFKVKS